MSNPNQKDLKGFVIFWGSAVLFLIATGVIISLLPPPTEQERKEVWPILGFMG